MSPDDSAQNSGRVSTLSTLARILLWLFILALVAGGSAYAAWRWSEAQLDKERAVAKARWAEMEQALDERLRRFEERLAAFERALAGVADGNVVVDPGARTLSVEGAIGRAVAALLKVQVDLAERNEGRAEAGLALVRRAILDAAGAASGSEREELTALAGLAERAAQALILRSPGARDQIEVLWHELNSFLAGPGDVPVNGGS